MDAKIWMDKVEMGLKVIECLDDKKVTLATYPLEVSAHDGWKSILSRRPDSKEIAWKDFKKAFFKKYYQ